MDLNKLRGFYDSLDNALDVVPHEQFRQIIFTRRKQVHTCNIVLRHQSEEDKENFEKLINYNVWDDFYRTPQGNVSALFVDLESIGSECLRIYNNQPHNTPHKTIEEQYDLKNFPEFVELNGYYINTESNGLDILGTKEYIVSMKDFCHKVKYYDKDGNFIKEDRDVIAAYEDWNGPKEIYDIAVKEGLPRSFLKKAYKDNGYFIIGVKPSKTTLPFPLAKLKNKLEAEARKVYE